LYGECEEPEEPEEELSGSEHEAEDEQTDSGVSSSPPRTPGNEAEEGSESGSGKDAAAISDDDVVPKDKPQPVNADFLKMETLPASLKLAQVSEEFGGKNLIICSIMGERSEEACTLLVVWLAYALFECVGIV